MDCIESILQSLSVPCVYAMRGARRVLPHQAYQVDGLSKPLPSDRPTCWVECLPETSESALLPGVTAYADHHGEHPCASAPPERFFEASSLGQVIGILRDTSAIGEDWGITEALLFEAANDHCKWSAASGECPGVDPERFIVWVTGRYAEFNNWDPVEFAEDVARATNLIEKAPRVPWLPGDIADLSAVPLPEQPCESGPYIQGLHYATHIACMKARRACVVTAMRKADGCSGLQLNGTGAETPAGKRPVEVFLKYWEKRGFAAPDLYGNSDRGYAGVWFTCT